MEEEHQRKPKVLFTFDPAVGMPEDFVPALQQRFALLRLDLAPDPQSFLALHAPSLRVLVGFHTSLPLLQALPNLQLLACPGVGINRIDLPLCQSLGINVTNGASASADDVADLAILLMLAALRRCCPAHKYVRQGLWHLQGAFRLATKVSFSNPIPHPALLSSANLLSC